MEIVKSLEEFDLLIKVVQSKSIQNEAKNRQSWISWDVIRYITC